MLKWQMKEKKNSIGSPDYSKSNKYWNYGFYAAVGLGTIAGAYIAYLYFNGDTNMLHYCWNKTKDGYNYIISYIPESIRNYIWRKIWPFGRTFDSSPPSPNLTDDESNDIYVLDIASMTTLELKIHISKILQDKYGLRITTDHGIRTFYDKFITQPNFTDKGGITECIKHYIDLKAAEAASTIDPFAADTRTRDFLYPVTWGINDFKFIINKFIKVHNNILSEEI